MNLVVIAGRLGRDPETRYTSGGQAITTFDVALNERRNGQQDTTWARCVLWNKHAETAQRRLKRGSFVLVQGRLRAREWERDGVKHKAFEINVDSFRALDSHDSEAEADDQREREADGVPF